ncbi:protein jagged-1b [Ctenocephalides felis]|uniref:protein jagged-1b n=1 Tax=Ctenocephalides felis TaxID=7515 RepID=UPI000E6E11E1|nr:protein jagged-1b [Ctenocephalides felis]
MVVSNLGTRDQRSKNNPSMEEAPHTNQKLYTSNTYNGLPKRINDLLDRSTPLGVYCSGFFELQILEIANHRGGRANGECCGTPSTSHHSAAIIGGVPLTTCRTPRPCATMFRLCLKEFQRPMISAPAGSGGLLSATTAPAGGCSFGNASTPVVGGTSFAVPEPYTAAMVLPFSFRWTRQFTLVLQALDFYNATYPETEHLIEEATYSGIIDPSSTWSTLEWESRSEQRRDLAGDRRVRLTYRVRVQCDRNYYNATCTKFCRPRDDKFGHYTCDSLGDKVCLPGWQGTNCEIAVCKAGCHPVHGNCDRPGECECRPGWRGPLCDECTPYPGCIHGYCNGSAWQCICDTNWGGILCDQDLNYCGTHEPCLHGGTCENTAPDQYLCSCAEGLSGRHCEIVDNPCAPQPCRNGGTCRERPGSGSNSAGAGGSNAANGYQCLCDAGWEGPNCETNIDDCVGNPCEHGGSCIDLVDGFRCECPSEWTGEHCETDVDECLSSPCANAVSCSNTHGGFHCTCAPGWGGALCARNIDDCVGQCLNGATCIDLVDDYHCACASGYTGRDCSQDVDECQTNPCRHGGECVDLVGGFRCICPVGRSGTLCEDDIDRCAPNPCQNGAECLNTPGGYYCHCPGGLTGRHCEGPRHPVLANDGCMPNPCQNNGTCLLGGPNGAAFTCLCSAGTRGRLCSEMSNSGVIGGSEDDCEGWFRCECPSEWTGEHCETDVDECLSSPCANAVSCSNTHGGFHCTCAPGWGGALCARNIDDCVGQCLNGATCIDLVDDYHCACASGYTGRDCSQDVDECQTNPCRHGGECVDLVGGFRCICPVGRSGTLCEVACSNDGCMPNPCQNNGTCLLGGPNGAAFTCLCSAGTRGRLCSEMSNSGVIGGSEDDCEGVTGRCLNGGICDLQRGRCNCLAGWTGPQCEEPLDQCHGEPCHNGGTCVGGPGWFRCECSRGFTGPDCRINVNECASSPCQGGAPCKDRIGGYTCLCPPGRAGERCEIETSGSGCWAPPNSTWLNECNTCTCVQGIQRCSNLWCGLQDCLGVNSTKCAPHEVCVPAPQESCLSSPCIARGDCRALEPSRRVAPPALPASPDCWPNQAALGEQCARVSALLETGKAPRGATSETLCDALRTLLGARLVIEPTADLRHIVVVLCEMKTGSNDTVEVTVSSPPGGNAGAQIVALSVRLLGELISRGAASSDGALPGAIREVKVETALLSSETQGGEYFIALICVMSIIVLAAVVLGIFVMRQRMRGRSISGMGLTPSPSDAFRAEEEKSNNLQNEENFRRYANPLKEERSTNPNVSLVRPIPGEALAGPSTTAQDFMHEYSQRLHKNKSLNPDLVHVDADLLHVDCNLKTAHRNSQILLYKAQNPDMRKNTTGTFDNLNKDFGKRSINMSTASSDSDVLTVLV